MFVRLGEMYYFCKRIAKTERYMTMLNAYFYGYYFYFAGVCEAVDRM